MRLALVTGIALVTIAAWAALAAGSPGHAGIVTPTVLDDFNDNSLNMAFWQPQSVVGTGVTLAETNQRLEIDFAANASGSFFRGGTASACALSGDFDLQVDYDLLVWPSGNGVRVGLLLSSLGTMSRIDDNSYSVNFGFVITVVPTTDLTGKFRITRVGSTFTGFYYSGGVWVSAGSGSAVLPNLMAMYLSSWSHDGYFGGQAAKVAFDNLILNSGTLVCPLQGDVDCSGSVNSVDALKVLRNNAMLTVTQTEPCPDVGSPLVHPFGDVDCSDAVNAVDALKILRDSAGLVVAQTEPCVDIKQPLYSP